MTVSLMDRVREHAFADGVPLAVHFDLTYRCNERCVHCYLDHEDHGEMTTAEVLGVIVGSIVYSTPSSPASARTPS